MKCHLDIAAHLLIFPKLSAALLLRFTEVQYLNQLRGLLQPQGWTVVMTQAQLTKTEAC